MKVLLGVCGGVAAYKAPEIVRALQDRGVDVEVALTAAAERFITALTFNALTGKRVHTSLWSPEQSEFASGPIEHIAVAQSIDVLLAAPVTATTLARFSHGLADDFLSAVYLATKAPVVLAPAMNVNMWQHPATQANVDALLARGDRLVAPDAGYLACGMTGSGRLAGIDSIVDATLRASFGPVHDLSGETVLITAGGTREAVDPVRFLGNRSSGRMGHALADAAHARGATVILVTASSLPVPPGCEVVRVETAAQMQTALNTALSRATVVIAAAAVADFRPAAPASTKLRRDSGLVLHLEPTPDLVAEAARRRAPGCLVVAFAAETDQLEENARQKLLRKGVDAIVANDIGRTDIGFDAEHNSGLFLTRSDTVELQRQTKRAMADAILDQVLRLRKNATSPSFPVQKVHSPF
ncbi:MAG: bifunctional phosphopantothenoylcysteine decarboxylase/phosphopantothenate--cysteine ligase CoaBC [Rhodospirillales bacterium]|nr:bifunctional phosphopantothenoylcysteine decarboxylase/phosphopantothenate--cysteine ligase CoaBC [Acetobacter sp.]